MPDPLLDMMLTRTQGIRPLAPGQGDIGGANYMPASPEQEDAEMGMAAGSINNDELSPLVKELLRFKILPQNVATLVEHLYGFEPEAVDPIRTALGTKATGYMVPHRAPINIPKGFELPQEFGPHYTSRPQPLIDKYVSQRNIKDINPIKPPSPEGKLPITTKGYSGMKQFINRGNLKLNPDMVKQIRSMSQDGTPIKAIGEAFPGVNPNTIRDVIVGNSWVHVK